MFERRLLFVGAKRNREIAIGRQILTRSMRSSDDFLLEV